MAKHVRKGLGRGIGALIGNDRPVLDNSSQDAGETGPGRRQIALAYIKPGASQPRRIFDAGALEELAQSISQKGLLQPLIVREVGQDTYELVAGERRWRAAQQAGLHHVPVIVQDYSDSDALEVAIIENVQRADLTPAEEARAYRRLMDDYGHRQEDLAKIVGKSRSHVANLLRLLSLPATVLALVDEGRLGMGHARALVGRDDAAALARKIVDEGLNVRAVEALTQKAKVDGGTSNPPRRPGRRGKDADTIAIEKALSAALGMKVRIDHKGEAGVITLAYPSVDAIDDLLDRLGISV